MEDTQGVETNDTKNKRSVLFATVQSAGVGVLACVATALAVDGTHASLVAKKLRLPSLQRVCDFVAGSKQSELKTSWLVLAVAAISGGYGFAEAIKHNRQASRDNGISR